MSTLQEQARALGDPTRHEIFQYIAGADDSVGVAELTAHTGLNHNAVRQHLGKLRDAGLVDEGIEDRSRPGRPRLQYRIDPRAMGVWQGPGPYERLAWLLVEALDTGCSLQDIGRRAGGFVHVARDRADDPIAAIEGEIAGGGFNPRVRRRGDRVDVLLQECPFVSAALTAPEIICELHLGLAQGMAEALGGIEVEELAARDPQRAGCRLSLRAAEAPTERTDARRKPRAARVRGRR